MDNDKYLNCVGEFEGEVEMPAGGWFQESSGEKKTPCIALTIVVAGDDVDAGKRINWYGWLSDKAIKYTIATLTKCFGFDGDLNALYDGKLSFAGQMVSFTTEVESYNGKDRCKIKWLNRHGYVHQAPKMDEVAAKTLIAGLLKRSKEAAAEAAIEAQVERVEVAPEAPKAEPAQGKPAPDDDVPF